MSRGSRGSVTLLLLPADPPSARMQLIPANARGNALSASCYTLTHDTDSYRPAAVLLYAAGRPLTRPGGRPQPLAAAYAPLTRSHTQARRHPRRAAPIAADAPPLQCVRLSTGARRCLERSLSLARAATRSRRSDHPQHPSRLEPRRPPSRRYTCADRQATSSCGRHGQHRSHKQPPSRARLEITRPVRRRPLARGHVAPRLDGRLPKLTALSYLGLAPPPHSSP